MHQPQPTQLHTPAPAMFLCLPCRRAWKADQLKQVLIFQTYDPSCPQCSGAVAPIAVPILLTPQAEHTIRRLAATGLDAAGIVDHISREAAAPAEAAHQVTTPEPTVDHHEHWRNRRLELIDLADLSRNARRQLAEPLKRHNTIPNPSAPEPYTRTIPPYRIEVRETTINPALGAAVQREILDAGKRHIVASRMLAAMERDLLIQLYNPPPTIADFAPGYPPEHLEPAQPWTVELGRCTVIMHGQQFRARSVRLYGVHGARPAIVYIEAEEPPEEKSTPPSEEPGAAAGA